MKLFLILALKYLVNHKRRTVSAVIGISVSVMMMTIITNVIFALNTTLTKTAVHLKQYPVEYQQYMEESTGKLLFLLLSAVVAISAMFIYHSFAISMVNKVKYIGILGSLGASRVQKLAWIYMEGFIVGAIGLVIGLGLGTLTAKGLLHLFHIYMLQEETFELTNHNNIFLIVLVCTIMVILLSCSVPAYRAGKIPILDQITVNCPEEIKGSKYDLMKKRNRIFGVEGALALKNIALHKKRNAYIIVVIIAMFCLLLDGYVYLQGLNGRYYVKDTRNRPELEMWVDVYSKDTEKIEKFYEIVSSNRLVASASLERSLDLAGIILDEKYFQKGIMNGAIAEQYGFDQINRTAADSGGRTVEGGWLRPFIVGVDDKTFQNYLNLAGIQKDGGQEKGVIIDDYFLIKSNEIKGFSSILNIEDHSVMNFTYSKYGDMDHLNWQPSGKVDELLEGEFQVLGTSSQAPPLPYYSMIPDRPISDQERFHGMMEVYMRMDEFNELLKSDAYIHTYGIHPEETVVPNYTPDKSIPTYMKIQLKRDSNSNHYSCLDKVLYHKKDFDRYKEDQEFEKVIDAAAKACGLKKGVLETLDINLNERALSENDTYAAGSKAGWQISQYSSSRDAALQIWGYGFIFLVVAFSLTSVFQQISAALLSRKGEFSMLMSMGMERRGIVKMIVFEYLSYISIAALTGIPFSIFLAYRTFDQLAMGYIIEPELPGNVIILQGIILIAMMILPCLYTLREVSHLNIVDHIKKGRE